MEHVHKEHTESKSHSCHHHSPVRTTSTFKKNLSSDAIYTCPMHPEIKQKGPGSCPICGMALEPLIANDAENEELKDMTKRFWMAAAFTIPLFVISMGDMLPGNPISQMLSYELRLWLELILALPVCLWSAWPFYVRGIDSIKRRHLNMFTLIGLGVSVAFVYSLIAVVFPGLFPPSFQDSNGHVGVYFEAAGVIVTLILP